MPNWLRASALAALFASAGAAVDWSVLKPQGCVSDYAGVVDSASRAQLENYCAAVERATGARLALAAIPTLQGEPIDDVAASIYRAWNLDRPGGGALLLLVVADRRTHLYTGAALRQAMPAGFEAQMLREMGPALRRQNYGEVLMAAADTMGSAIARAKKVKIDARLARRYQWRLADSIPWAVLGGLALAAICLVFAGAPRGFGGGGNRGLLPALTGRRPLARDSWGSRGSGGFGAFDSGDSVGGFGGAEPGSRRGGGDW